MKSTVQSSRIFAHGFADNLVFIYIYTNYCIHCPVQILKKKIFYLHNVIGFVVEKPLSINIMLY